MGSDPELPLMIKLTADGTKVLTKTVNGVARVSCSCCSLPDPDCCYYPADLLGILFAEADLPTAMRFGPYGSNGGQTIVASRSGSVYGPVTTDDGTQQKYELGTVNGGPRWVFSINSGDGYQVADSYVCLFQDPEVDGAWLLDDFEDSYTVEVYSLPQSGPPEETFTIERTSLCEWRDESGDNVLAYNAREAGSAADMWFFQTSPRVDAGPYNSPVGEYAEGNVLWVVS
jgi:hypothetical protein